MPIVILETLEETTARVIDKINQKLMPVKKEKKVIVSYRELINKQIKK